MTSQEKREVMLTEHEAEMISLALSAYSKSCLRNAFNCLSGYQKASSTEKSKEWKMKATEAQELADSVLYQQAGI